MGVVGTRSRRREDERVPTFAARGLPRDGTREPSRFPPLGLVNEQRKLAPLLREDRSDAPYPGMVPLSYEEGDR
jgi:hypothetical protein